MGVLLQACKTVSLVLFYYSFSISLTFYNKWILTVSDARRAINGAAFYLTRTHRVSCVQTGIPVPSVDHNDPPHHQVPHCLGGEEDHLPGDGETPTRSGLARVSPEYLPSLLVVTRLTAVTAVCFV